MKKKVKRMVKWFFTKTDRGQQNLGDCTSLYQLVERLQYRLEGLENEHLQILSKLHQLGSKLDNNYS